MLSVDSDPELVVTDDHTSVVPPPPPSPPGAEEFGEARLTVRLPGYLKETDNWVIHLYDTIREETKKFTLNYPSYPAPFPFYDWSADGTWLILVDNGFLRLMAPSYDYERIITHHYDACRYAAWINR